MLSVSKIEMLLAQQYLISYYILIDGDLMKYISSRAANGPVFTDDQIIDILGQLTLALIHSHARKIYHRDVKMSNIFVAAEKAGGGVHVKLGDFGAGRAVDNTEACVGSQVGTQGYMAPEVFDFGKYTSKADTWSLGVVVYALASNGGTLFFGKPNHIK